jgi:hypothetical protein
MDYSLFDFRSNSSFFLKPLPLKARKRIGNDSIERYRAIHMGGVDRYRIQCFTTQTGSSLHSMFLTTSQTKDVGVGGYLSQMGLQGATRSRGKGWSINWRSVFAGSYIEGKKDSMIFISFGQKESSKVKENSIGEPYLW